MNYWGWLFLVVAFGIIFFGFRYMIQEDKEFAGNCESLCELKNYTYNYSAVNRYATTCWCNTVNGRVDVNDKLSKVF